MSTPDGHRGERGEDAVGEVELFGAADAVASRRAASEQRAQLERRRGELEAQLRQAREDVERRRAELDRELAQKRAELEALMAPVKDYLAKVTEVMWSVDLFLGRDESLQLIRDGQPAPADTPISLRQRVLVMAEESLVLMGRRATGMDGDDIPEFISWLLEDDAHLDRVLPEPKGVVVLIPTKVESRSGNVFEDAYKSAVNQRSWWLLRNGQRLYLLTVDPELRIFDRVLPRRDEFTEVFDRRLFGFGSPAMTPVEPGSEEWLQMERIADARRRHYMRVLMVLEGIIARTPVWHPLPEGGASFLRLADQDAGKIRLIQDGDDSLQLTDGRESFAAYQRRLNRLLRPGMRVIGNWHNRDFDGLYVKGDTLRRGYHPRLHPGNAEHPPANEPLLIEDRRDGGLVIRYQRHEMIEKRNVPVPGEPGYVYPVKYVETTQRASCIVDPTDTWVLALDLATTAELEYYLNSRDNRSSYLLSMVPTVRAALDAKKAEAEQEAPFRDLLERLLIMEGAAAEEAPALVDELVHWWKVANTWARPLNGAPEHEGRAARAIVAEYRARRQHEDDPAAAAMIEAGKAIPGAIAVARDRAGTWRVYSASTPAHDAGVFLDVTALRRRGATLGTVEKERTIATRTASALHVAWSAPEWSSWKFGANPNHYLTAAERAAASAELRALAPGLVLCVTEHFDPTRPQRRTMAVYSWRDGDPTQAPTVARGNPLSWHYVADGPIQMTVRQIAKDATGVQLVKPDDGHEHSAAFDHFNSGRGEGQGTPWWPEDATRYSGARPRLVWADEDALRLVREYVDRCVAAATEIQARRRAVEAEAYSYTRPVEALIRARQERAAHDRFVEDFGTDAEDLWPAHLASLQLRDPIHPRTLWGLVAIALEHGRPVVGQTLGQLAAHALAHDNRAPGEWHVGAGPIDVGEYADIVIPAPADAEDGRSNRG